MSVSTPPPPAPKKRGWGCCGCGCALLAILAILFIGLMVAGTYMGYTKVILPMTSATPAAIPSAPDDETIYTQAKQKVTDFNRDLDSHHATTLHLSADELNSFMAHDPTMAANHVHAFVTLDKEQGRLQATLPTDRLSWGTIKNRYVNIDTTFGLDFDHQTRTINFAPQSLQVGDRNLMDSDANTSSESSTAATHQAFMNAFTPALNQSLNSAIRQNPNGKAFLDQAKSIEIKDGEVVIETE